MDPNRVEDPPAVQVDAPLGRPRLRTDVLVATLCCVVLVYVIIAAFGILSFGAEANNVKEHEELQGTDGLEYGDQSNITKNANVSTKHNVSKPLSGAMTKKEHWDVVKEAGWNTVSLLCWSMLFCIICSRAPSQTQNYQPLPDEQAHPPRENPALGVLQRASSGILPAQEANTYDYEVHRQQSLQRNRSGTSTGDHAATRAAEQELVRENMLWMQWENGISFSVRYLIWGCIIYYFSSMCLCVGMVTKLGAAPRCAQPLRFWVVVEILRKFLFVCDCYCCATNLRPRWFPASCKPLTLGIVVSLAWFLYGGYILKHTTTCHGSELETAMAQYIIEILSMYFVVAPVVLIVTEVLPLFNINLALSLLSSLNPAAPAGTVERLRLIPYTQEQFQEEDGSLKECCICAEAFDADKPIRETPCEHVFHEECLTQWVEEHRGNCPLCRQDILELLDARDAGNSSSPAGGGDVETADLSIRVEPTQIDPPGVRGDAGL